jgi:hypothetical protein
MDLAGLLAGRTPGAVDTTDARGIAELPEVRAGRVTIVAHGNGFVPTVAIVESGRNEEVVVREADVRSVRVRVLDGEGKPLPAAFVSVSGMNVPDFERSQRIDCSVAQLAGDLEIANPCTGPDGVVVISAPAGKIEYRVTLGRAVATATSSADAVTISLDPPEK